jgi:phosphatidate cytidylyltransferase
MAQGRRSGASRPPRAGRPEPPPRAGRSERPSRRRPEREPRRRSDLLARVLVAIPAAFVAVVFIDLGKLPFALLLIVAGCACMAELYRLLERWKPVPLIGFAALTAMVLVAYYGNLREVLEVAVAAVPLLFLAVAARPGRAGATVAIAGTLLGIYWIGFAFAHAELLRQLPHGKGIVLDVAIGTFVGDTAAYFGGRLFGRRPLAPSISPSKTVEGLVCGALAAILAVFLASQFQSFVTHGDALLLGFAVAVLGPIGDLFESLIKRDAGAKDTGSLFGAHGGALDRLDGVMFTIVAGYYIWLSIVH